MTVMGYLAAGLMGLTLGLIGGGGSILTVPILVYLFGIDPLTATGYSLCIVGVTALFGSLNHFRLGHVEARAALLFGVPGVLGVTLTRRLLLPRLPDPVFTAGGWSLPLGVLLLVLLAVLMVFAARYMLRPSEVAEPRQDPVNMPGLVARGFLTGSLTSLVGAGGGFLIVPALAAFARLPVKQAIGTSLLIIAANGLIGAAVDPHLRANADGRLLIAFTAVAIVGTVIGSQVSRSIPGERLRPAFGWFVLVMGVAILGRELSRFW